MKPGDKIIWRMRIAFSTYDVRDYVWIENAKGESAFIWLYIGCGW